MEIFSMLQSTKEFTMKIQTLMTALVLAASGAVFAQTAPASKPVLPVAQAAKADGKVTKLAHKKLHAQASRNSKAVHKPKTSKPVAAPIK